VPRDTPPFAPEGRGDWSDPTIPTTGAMPPYTRPQHVAQSFSNFSIAGTSHIRNWKWASTAAPVLRALSVMNSSKPKTRSRSRS
jgi:hypothetical protein